MPESNIDLLKDIALALLSALGGGAGIKLLTHKADSKQQAAETEKAQADKFSTRFEQARQLLDWMKARMMELQIYIEQLEAKTTAQQELIGELKAQVADLKAQVSTLKARLESLDGTTM